MAPTAYAPIGAANAKDKTSAEILFMESLQNEINSPA
jgi:hypothetical protein